MFTITEIIKLVDDELSKVTSNYYYKSTGMLHEKAYNLTQLKEMLEKKSQDETTNLDFKTPITEILAGHIKVLIKSHSLLNIAAMYCPAEVVAYLLDNGAKADNTTIHHASRGWHPDMDRVIEVLKNHDVDLNSANKKGESALYKAVRNKNKEEIGLYYTGRPLSECKNQSVACLQKYGAHMFFAEKIKAPIQNFKDKVEAVCNKVTIAYTTGGFTGC